MSSTELLEKPVAETEEAGGGVFLDMMERHARDVEVRCLTFNFQDLPLPETSEGWREKSNDLATVRRLARHSRQIGLDGVSSVPPFFFNYDERGIIP